jgi:hypothetical protein
MFGELGKDVRKWIWRAWRSFLSRMEMEANISDKDIDSRSYKKINGRPVSNIDHGGSDSSSRNRSGMELALWREGGLSVRYLKTVIDSVEAFEVGYHGSGSTEVLNIACSNLWFAQTV